MKNVLDSVLVAFTSLFGFILLQTLCRRAFYQPILNFLVFHPMHLYFINKDIKTQVTSIAFLTLSVLVLKFKKKKKYSHLDMTPSYRAHFNSWRYYYPICFFFSGAQRPLFYGFIIMSQVSIRKTIY